MLIIPAIDIINGSCVRLTKGDYTSEKKYSSSPLDIAKLFEDSGLTRLHLVDLDGAKSGSIKNLKTLETIANKTNLIIDFGGGLKTKESLEDAFNAGARFVTCGSLAVKNKELVFSFLDKYKDRIILGADCLNNKIAISGWKEVLDIDVITFIDEYQKKGVKYVISTDISKDGMLEGPSFPLYKNIQNNVKNINIIASGGVSSYEDLVKLKEMNLYATIVGKAYYENKISLKELRSIEC